MSERLLCIKTEYVLCHSFIEEFVVRLLLQLFCGIFCIKISCTALLSDNVFLTSGSNECTFVHLDLSVCLSICLSAHLG